MTTLESQNRSNNNVLLGFSCSFGGRPTSSVMKISKLIENSEYKTIRGLLNTGNNAEKYLAVLVCEKLVIENRILLTAQEKEKIKNLYQSKDIVSVCSGCTYFKRKSLHVLLNEKNYFSEMSKKWVARIMKKYKIK